ncbi:MAG: AMP nucleosidase [bacterium]
MSRKDDPKKIALSALERYTGSDASMFRPYVLLTNFGKYVDHFAAMSDHQKHEGTAMQSAHWPEENISIVDFGVGSPMAALIIELLSYIRPRVALMLGLCGGLNPKYSIGNYFNPIAAIRDEGTSDHFFPPRVPSLSSFEIQRFVVNELDKLNIAYHSGVVHTTNVRFWEFDEDFIEKLKTERCQAIDMECATLFTVGYARRVAVGALMLISDLPLERGGIKTKESSQAMFKKHTDTHIELGIKVIRAMREALLDPGPYT